MVRLYLSRMIMIFGYCAFAMLMITILHGFPNATDMRLGVSIEYSAIDITEKNMFLLWPLPKTNNTYDKYRLLRQLSFEPVQWNRTIRILLAQGFSSWYLKRNVDHFSDCLVTNCVLEETIRRSTNQNTSAYDAILFRNSIDTSLEKYRTSEQVWIWYTLESPINMGPPRGVKVNWTATYRYDSDIPAPYGYYLSKRMAERFPLVDPGPFIDSDFVPNDLSDKRKMIAWFVSNCYTSNKRSSYVQQLSQYMDVDIYGSCGKLTCRKNDPACFEMLSNDYKFYLAFENSNCRDYVSERFYETALRQDIIPVVMGASKDFYASIAPPHSFIHVDDFASPKHLADFLHQLAKNQTAYSEYFAWKQDGGSFINTKFFCRLCALLNKPKRKSYADLQSWWEPSGSCKRIRSI